MNPKILIVEDQPLTQQMIGMLLEKLGYDYEVCDDGEQALARLKAGAQEFEIVLLDLFMPKIDGISVLGHIRSNMPHLKVIIITASEDPSYCDTAMSHGAYAYLQKPFSPAKLQILLQELLPAPTFGSTQLS